MFFESLISYPKTKVTGLISCGYLGMAAAFTLARAGHRVTVFETSDGKNNVSNIRKAIDRPPYVYSLYGYRLLTC